jgi:hypothetical protein
VTRKINIKIISLLFDFYINSFIIKARKKEKHKMKKYELYHYHNGMWWGAGQRTQEQINALIAVANWTKQYEDCTLIHLFKLFEKEPLWKVVEVK